MEPERFSKFRHKAVHELMDLNELCEKEYLIPHGQSGSMTSTVELWLLLKMECRRYWHRFRSWEQLLFLAARGFGDGQMKACLLK